MKLEHFNLLKSKLKVLVETACSCDLMYGWHCSVHSLDYEIQELLEKITIVETLDETSKTQRI